MNAKAFTLLTAALMILSVAAAQPIVAASYTITVQTDASSYSGAQTLVVSGTVSPAPGPNTAVFLKILNPSGTPVDFSPASVNGSTGFYQQSFVLGGSSSWVAGTYTVNATWGNSALTHAISKTTAFVYSPTASTTTTTTTSTTTSTSSTSTPTTSTTTTRSTTSTTSSTTTTSSTSTTTSSTSTAPPTTSSSTSSSTTTTSSSTQGGGGIPEFPFQVLATTLFTVLVLASYLLARRYAVLGGRLRGQ